MSNKNPKDKEKSGKSDKERNPEPTPKPGISGGNGEKVSATRLTGATSCWIV